MADFLDNRTEKIISNSQYLSWSGAPQGSTPGLMLFLIYMNELSENLASSPKLFADGTSLVSVVKNVDALRKKDR